MQPLPIDPVLPELIAAVRQHSCVVLRAPTGAGKTTRVPPGLLDAGINSNGRILLVEPRRLAARAAARRMASERGSLFGDEVGYHIRFDRQFGPRTRILAVTPGILLQMLHGEAYLEGIGAVLFDEFHERSLDNDLALALVRLIQQTVRPELKIVVMSATLAVENVASYLGGCPIIAAEGRQFSVAIEHRPRPEARAWPAAVTAAVRDLLDRTDGDLLVFLPGWSEIRQAARHLEPLTHERNLAVLPLHGDLSAEKQDAALLPQPRRKVVLATNVAETSVTIEGITGVVDSGLARILTFDPAVGLDRLQVAPISQASADQRAGRAGRTGPGVCIRLWSASAHRARPEHTDPEIRRVDVTGAVLHLLALGERDAARFPWLEPPSTAAVEQALTLLRRLGALDDNGVTPLGRSLARLPVHPRLARMLVEGHRLGVLDRAALAAALLSERDPFVRSVEFSGRDARRTATASDVLDRVEALEEYERHGRTQTPLGHVNRSAARFVLRARDQLRRVASVGPQLPDGVIRGLMPHAHPDESFLRSIFAAFPDRLACRREPGSPRGLMRGGRGVRLAPSSGVTEPELFLCIDVDSAATEALVRQASLVQRDWLPPDRLRFDIAVAFDPETERVTARRRLYYEDILLE